MVASSDNFQHHGSPTRAGQAGPMELQEGPGCDTPSSKFFEPRNGINIAAKMPTSKKFNLPSRKILESDMAEGFSWQPRQVNHPGQFSERPRKPPVGSGQITKMPLAHDPLSRDEGLNPQVLQNPQISKTSRQKDRPAPVILPELGYDSSEPMDLVQFPSPKNKVFSQLPEVIPDSLEVQAPRDATHRQSSSPSVANENPGSPQAPQGASNKTLQEGFENSQPNDLLVPKTTDQLPVLNSEDSQTEHQLRNDMESISLSSQQDERRQSVVTDVQAPAEPSYAAVSGSKRPRHRSPISVCGDLERPTRCSPQKDTYRPRNNRKQDLPVITETNRRHNSSCYSGSQRSHSRASNISKRRKGIQKPVTTRLLNDKRRLYESVAQQWNQIITANEEELRDEIVENQHLRASLVRQNERLKAAQIAVSKREAQIQKAEEILRVNEKKHSGAIQEKEQLMADVETPQRELSESREGAKNVAEKYKSCKNKINEAIVEQQDLYKRSQVYYQRMLVELEQQKSQQDLKYGEVDEALKASNQKRAEMRQVFQEVQRGWQEETEKKDQNLVELQTICQSQVADLAREKETIGHLRAQIDETQLSTYLMVQGLDSKVTTLAASYQEGITHDQHLAGTVRSLVERIDALEQTLNASLNERRNSTDLATMISQVEDNMCARIIASIKDVHCRQDSLEGVLGHLGTGFNEELACINRSISSYIHQRNEETRDKRLETEVSEKLDKLQLDLEKLQGIFSKLELDFTAMIKREFEAIRADGEVLQATHQLNAEHHSRILTLRQDQLEQLVGGYVEEARQVHQKLTGGEDLARTITKAAVDQVHEHIDRALSVQERASVRSFEDTTRAISELRTLVENATSAMNHGQETEGSAENSRLRQELHEQQSLVSSLTKEAHKAEQLAIDSEHLRGRWLQDMMVVESLKKKLSAAHHRLPRVESIAAKLEGIGRLTERINSISSYFSGQQRWVQSQTGTECTEDSVLETQPTTQSSEPTEAEYVALSPLESQETIPDSMSQTATLGEFPQRKVEILNPLLDFRSPSPPPSIQQEQERRREQVNTRSSISRKAGSGKRTNFAEIEDLNFTRSQSQYNRPVMPNRTPAPTASVDQSVVDQIRSGQIPIGRPESSFEFPTIADFQKSSQEDGNIDELSKKRNAPVVLGSIHRIAKRFKSEARDVKAVNAHDTPTVAAYETSKDSATRPGSIRTYSRKVE